MSAEPFPVEPLNRVFAALADPTRRDIVARLAVGDTTVNALAEPYDVSVQAVSKHLKVLEDAGLVSRPGTATRRPVHLEAEVFDLMTKWIERYRRQAEERYRRLADVLRAMPDEPAPTTNRGQRSSPKSKAISPPKTSATSRAKSSTRSPKKETAP